MLKTVIKIVGAYVAFESIANLGKGYMLGCMMAANPESEDVAFWHECVEYNMNKSCIDKVKTATILAGEKLGKAAMEKQMKS